MRKACASGGWARRRRANYPFFLFCYLFCILFWGRYITVTRRYITVTVTPAVRSDTLGGTVGNILPLFPCGYFAAGNHAALGERRHDALRHGSIKIERARHVERIERVNRSGVAAGVLKHRDPDGQHRDSIGGGKRRHDLEFRVRCHPNVGAIPLHQTSD